MAKDDTVGYRYTDTGRFDVSIYPTGKDSDHPGLIIVKHPLAGPHSMGPEDPDDFWSKDPDKIRDIAIRGYVNSIDIQDSDLMVVSEIMDDAEALGIDLGGDGNV